MTEKSHPFYKYLFLFDKGKDKVILQGKEIANYWNDIYDLFWEKGKMIIQKLNGSEFSEKEIKELFWDLYDDMSDDDTIIKLWIPSLYKLEFHHFGDLYEQPIVKEKIDKLSEEEFDQFVDFFEGIRKSLCEMNLEWALEERRERELKEIVKGFKIKNIWTLNEPPNQILKQYLIFFKKAKEGQDKWALNLRNILDNNQKRKGDLKKIYEKILCNSSIRGSTHEGKGIVLGKQMREYTKEEIRFCERIIKIYLKSLISKARLNKQ